MPIFTSFFRTEDGGEALLSFASDGTEQDFQNAFLRAVAEIERRVVSAIVLNGEGRQRVEELKGAINDV